MQKRRRRSQTEILSAFDGDVAAYTLLVKGAKLHGYASRAAIWQKKLDRARAVRHKYISGDAPMGDTTT